MNKNLIIYAPLHLILYIVDRLNPLYSRKYIVKVYIFRKKKGWVVQWCYNLSMLSVVNPNRQYVIKKIHASKTNLNSSSYITLPFPTAKLVPNQRAQWAGKNISHSVQRPPLLFFSPLCNKRWGRVCLRTRKYD